MPGADGASELRGHPAQGVACYLLNLDRSAGRLVQSTARLNAACLDPIRVPGVDGSALATEQRGLADRRTSRRLTGRALSDGEVGCYLGHLRALERMLEDGVPHALVCEDDVRPAPVLGELCLGLSRLGPLGLDWKVAILAKPAGRLFTEVAAVDTRTRSFRVQLAHYPPMNAWANLWTRDGAAEMLAAFGRPVEPWDHAVRRFAQRSDGALSVDPSPILPPEDASEIDRRGSRGTRGPVYRWRKWRRLSQQKARARQLMRDAANAHSTALQLAPET